MKKNPKKLPQEVPVEATKLEPLKIPVEFKVREPKGVPIIEVPIELPAISTKDLPKKRSKSKVKPEKK